MIGLRSSPPVVTPAPACSIMSRGTPCGRLSRGSSPALESFSPASLLFVHSSFLSSLVVRRGGNDRTSYFFHCAKIYQKIRVTHLVLALSRHCVSSRPYHGHRGPTTSQANHTFQSYLGGGKNCGERRLRLHLRIRVAFWKQNTLPVSLQPSVCALLTYLRTTILYCQHVRAP
ncbi:hypothetical protein BU24DRAFT_152175 [Aaosphaeria arxii CBS 175.79]|uniref:Uncharacterized protein n=1 Tax=Aaosphaeria arxii CBS 175.79 TaxID=1450172 RepID=A0A6A5XY08_9PLEO|nr:uncharacterized protein BU24DRAFT_152175 [Aaosphaeria arxii CBS 175.79]KAF2017530.1 hypothetical protein BU24DRAFT_152175 [Aaosphaeria arxii CBS 175.79]